jgi:hypothetical protein
MKTIFEYLSKLSLTTLAIIIIFWVVVLSWTIEFNWKVASVWFYDIVSSVISMLGWFISGVATAVSYIMPENKGEKPSGGDVNIQA